VTELGVTMPGLGTRIQKFAGWAKLAEDAGFDTVYDYEIWRNPFTVHMTCAAATSRITLALESRPRSRAARTSSPTPPPTSMSSQAGG